LTLAKFLRSAGGCEWLDRLKKCVGEVSVRFKLELNKVGFSFIHTDENLQDWGRGIVDAIPRKLFADIY